MATATALPKATAIRLRRPPYGYGYGPYGGNPYGGYGYGPYRGGYDDYDGYGNGSGYGRGYGRGGRGHASGNFSFGGDSDLSGNGWGNWQRLGSRPRLGPGLVVTTERRGPCRALAFE